eukprot:TRINITY_DN2609_c0_g1_i1.p1 TRINITY_DN2609_c0_g1~~TRINITY_DN2609_c0_g1_i1.p1  ORF type:complete len:794 (-),score=225.71 TRINITY_DN2609_c0_g1_i1:31-2412(-)
MGSAKRLLGIYLAVMVLAPAMWTLVHGDADITDQNTPTPDTDLRANEGIPSKTDHEAIIREEEQINPNGMSIKEQKILQSGEKHTFQAEVNKLMNIIINSLYSNSEIFLRELISNASDSLDKIRFFSLTDPTQLESEPKMEIKISFDKEQRTITIRDTGVGMTKEDLINNLGTIAKSGTTEFLKAYQTGTDSSLIGQFGVGFYSVFLVADAVTVTSKHNNDKQHVWISDAQGSFTVAEDPRGDTLGRGTEIVLHLKEEAEEFMEANEIKRLVRIYSEFINYPIYLYNSKVVQKEVEDTDAPAEEEDTETISLDGNEEPKEKKKKTKTISESVWSWELMNETKPIWTRNPKDITEEEYSKFYRAFSKETTDPIMHIHFIAEGEIEFKSLLYIPANAPKNMFEQSKEAGHRGLRLYVRRVFITDEFRDILPKYLSFLRGVIDSDDLPLNVSREMLQESKTLKIIKKKLVRKAISMFQQMSEGEDRDKFMEFWRNYGQNIKLGVIEDQTNRQRLSQLMMFRSSKTGELSSLQKYVDRMKEGQKDIYFLACTRVEDCQTSPLAEKLHDRGFEIMYMLDPIDEYTVNTMERFDGKYKLINIGKEGLDLGKEVVDEEKFKESVAELKDLKDWLAQTLNIEKCVVTARLVSFPAAVVSSLYGWTANMERIAKAQALADPNAAMLNAPKKILEINPDHGLIKELNRRVKENKEDPVAIELAELIYEVALLTTGFEVADSALFASRVLAMMVKSHHDELPQEVVEQVGNTQPLKAPEVTNEIEVPTGTKSNPESEDPDRIEL